MAMMIWHLAALTLLSGELLRQGVGALCLLALLALSVTLTRGGRERRLLLWICGWLFFIVAREFDYASGLGAGVALLSRLTPICYALSFSLLAISICNYLGARWARRLCLGLGLAAMLFSALAGVDKTSLFVLASQLTQWGMLVVVIALVVRFRRSGGMPSLWVMSAAVVLMRLQDIPGYQGSALFVGGAFDVFFALTAPWLAFEEARERQQRLRAMRELGGVILETRDLQALLQRTMRIYCEQGGAEAAFVMLLEEKGLRLHQQAGLGELLNELRQTPLPIDGLYGLRHLREGQPVRRNLSDARLFVGDEPLRSAGFVSTLMLPLRTRGRLLGVVVLCSRHRHHYSAPELRFWQSSAEQSAAAVENLRILARLFDSQRQWAATFDSIGEMILVHDDQQRLLRMNHAMISRLGARRGGFYGKTCADVLPHASSGCPYCRRVKSRQLEGPDPCFGGVTTVATSSFADGQGRGVVHVITDITRGREAERSYRMLFECVQEGVFISTPEGRIIDCNAAFASIFGYESKDELLAANAESLYINPAERAALLRRLRLQGYVQNFELSCVRRDGSALLLAENSFAVRDTLGAVQRIQGLVVDITARRRQEEQMRRRNRELHALNEIANALAHSLDLDEVLSQTLRLLVDLEHCDIGGVYVRDAESRIFRRRAGAGYQSQTGRDNVSIELTEAQWARLREGRFEVVDYEDELGGMLTSALGEAEELTHGVIVYFWRQMEPLGLLRLGRRNNEPLGEYERELALSTARQIASAVERVSLYEDASKAYEDLSRAQQQLLQSEKMSSMGRMISGVAHELNNPLTAIVGYAQLLEAEPLGEQARDYVAKLWRQTQRTQKVVQNLLSFARQSKPSRSMLDLRAVFDETLALREYDLNRHDIELTRRYDKSLPRVSGDANQLEQVFLNILNNALDAMLDGADGGRLEVAITRVEQRVQVEIHDSGHGLVEPSRVFDPFYTTKPIGKGTGLGLSICYGIIKEHDGDIIAFNHPAGGAVFRVDLPCAAEPVELADAPAAAEPMHGRILLINHDDASRDFLADAISGAGVELVSAARVEEAMARMQRESFDLIVVSSSLPTGYTPEEILHFARRCQPLGDARLLLLLEANEQRAAWIAPPAGVDSLRRPFDLAALLGRLRHILAQPVASR